MMSLHYLTGRASPDVFPRPPLRTNVLAALCLALALLAAPGTPQAGEARVVVVNVERLMMESARARAVADRIEKDFAPRRQKVQAQLRQLRDMSDKLGKDSPHLSDREYLLRERALGELEREVRRTQAQIREDFAERDEAERAALARRIHAILLALPGQLGVDLVLTRTVWHRPAIDVTDKAAALLDK